jgi:hypothetical protein
MTDQKSPPETPKPNPGDLVPPKHGKGLLRHGSKPGGPPGPGRPPSAIREAMREALADRIAIAEQIADNVEASTSDRLRALDLLAKYGLGTKSEVTGEDGAPIHAGVVILPMLKNDDATG